MCENGHMGSESRKTVSQKQNQSAGARVAREEMLHALRAASHTSLTPTPSAQFVDEVMRADDPASQIEICRPLSQPVREGDHKATKRALRTKLRAEREASRGQLDGSHVATEIWNTISPAVRKHGLPCAVAGYEALLGELSISRFMAASETSEIEVWRPVVSSAQGIKLSALPVGFVTSSQPSPAESSARIDPPVSLVLVPAMAVDEDGARLGQGGGWYDRALTAIKRAHPTALFFAAIPGKTYLSRGLIPTEPHDIPMDGVITEAGWTLF